MNLENFKNTFKDNLKKEITIIRSKFNPNNKINYVIPQYNKYLFEYQNYKKIKPINTNTPNIDIHILYLYFTAVMLFKNAIKNMIVY
jgi:hypothetical protein